MQGTAGLIELFERSINAAIIYKLTLFNGSINTGEILINHAPGAQIHVANL